MLTKRDLELIGQVVDERLEIKLEEKLDQKLEEKLDQKLEEKLNAKFHSFELRLDDKLESKFEEKLSPIKKDIYNIKKKMNRINKTLNLVVRKYDEGDVQLDRRVTRIENHLGLS